MAGIDFEIKPADVEESAPHRDPGQFVRHLAEKKATAIAKYEKHPVIGCDTVVVLDGRILGKPVDRADAQRMLHDLSGRIHEVYTGVCVMDPSDGRILTDHRRSSVWMRNLTGKEILDYIESEEPMDKAGSYAIQGQGAVFIEQIQGDYFCVVGLPLELLFSMLQKFGVLEM